MIIREEYWREVQCQKWKNNIPFTLQVCLWLAILHAGCLRRAQNLSPFLLSTDIQTPEHLWSFGIVRTTPFYFYHRFMGLFTICLISSILLILPAAVIPLSGISGNSLSPVWKSAVLYLFLNSISTSYTVLL